MNGCDVDSSDVPLRKGGGRWMFIQFLSAKLENRSKIVQIMNIYCSSSRELVLWHSEFVLEYGLLIRGIFCDHRNEDAKRAVF